MMTLEEGIKYAEDIAKMQRDYVECGACCDDTEIEDNCLKYAEEYEQLAEWLKELKALKQDFIRIECMNITEEQLIDIKSKYNMPPIGLFGKRCRIKHVSDLERGFVYRIVNSGVRSNYWKELPLGRYGDEAIQHNNMEDIVFVICDTLIDENSKIERVALKDIEIMQGETIPPYKVKKAIKEIEQWQELKETIIEMRDNDGICTQQEVCKFLANLMGVLEKQAESVE